MREKNAADRWAARARTRADRAAVLVSSSAQGAAEAPA